MASLFDRRVRGNASRRHVDTDFAISVYLDDIALDPTVVTKSPTAEGLSEVAAEMSLANFAISEVPR